MNTIPMEEPNVVSNAGHLPWLNHLHRAAHARVTILRAEMSSR